MRGLQLTQLQPFLSVQLRDQRVVSKTETPGFHGIAKQQRKPRNHPEKTQTAPHSRHDLTAISSQADAVNDLEQRPAREDPKAVTAEQLLG